MESRATTGYRSCVHVIGAAVSSSTVMPKQMLVCIYSQLRSFSSSEVAAMIEGLVRHDTGMRVEKNFVDSYGQSEVAFAFCHLLGTVRLMPRLRRIKL
jgi:TnpA family transposase